VSDRESQNYEDFIPDIANNPVIADAIAPQTRTAAFERFAKVARVLATLDPVVQPVEDPAANLRVELAKLARSRVGDLNRPSQALS